MTIKPDAVDPILLALDDIRHDYRNVMQATERRAIKQSLDVLNASQVNTILLNYLPPRVVLKALSRWRDEYESHSVPSGTGQPTQEQSA